MLKYSIKKPIQHNTSYFTEHTNFVRKVGIRFTISKCQPENTSLFILRGQHGNLHQLSVTTGRVTRVILHTQEPVLAIGIREKSQERFWKNAGELTAMVEVSRKEIPGSR